MSPKPSAKVDLPVVTSSYVVNLMDRFPRMNGEIYKELIKKNRDINLIPLMFDPDTTGIVSITEDGMEVSHCVYVYEDSYGREARTIWNADTLSYESREDVDDSYINKNKLDWINREFNKINIFPKVGEEYLVALRQKRILFRFDDNKLLINSYDSPIFNLLKEIFLFSKDTNQLYRDYISSGVYTCHVINDRISSLSTDETKPTTQFQGISLISLFLTGDDPSVYIYNGFLSKYIKTEKIPTFNTFTLKTNVLEKFLDKNKITKPALTIMPPTPKVNADSTSYTLWETTINKLLSATEIPYTEAEFPVILTEKNHVEDGILQASIKRGYLYITKESRTVTSSVMGVLNAKFREKVIYTINQRAIVQ